MATPIDEELSQIGKALVAAADGKSVELTGAQHEVLARAAFPDMLDAILTHAPILPRHDAMRPIAGAWSDELRDAFQSQSIADGIAEDNSLQSIQNVVSQDDRLSTEEKQVLLRALRDRYVQSNSGSTSSQSPPDLGSRPRPRAYLGSIAVEGFRGIGQRADLQLEPQPGLTLIYGANGSGKSTFAEALDVLLTGSTARFAGRGREWRSAWANAHSPNRGQINTEFVVEDRDTQHDTVMRDWTEADLSAAASEKDNPLWGAVQTIGGLDVAGAIDEFRPILGYGELGPLFDESDSPNHNPGPDLGKVTLFAQHIRARANIRDETTDALWELITHHKHRDPFYDVLSAWASILDSAFPLVPDSYPYAAAARQAGWYAPPSEQALRSVIGDTGIKATLRSTAEAILRSRSPVESALRSRPPSGWNWRALEPAAINHPGMRKVARAYLPNFSDSVRAIVMQSVEDDAKNHVHLIGRDPSEHLLAHVRDDVRRKTEEFLDYTPRVRSYAEMLLDEIHSARLEQFSQRVSDIWGKIRHDSSDVQFEALSLQQHRPVDERSRSTPELRVSLGLTIDGDRPIERGALSQGELHSLALSVFLPTLMRPESPFGFAVIDDPVQAMDEHAVYGLAEVLLKAAKDLQVVVFTHDKRLISAVQLLDSDREDHKLINVTRSAGSVVRCEVADRPAEHALKLARIAAARPVDDDSWANVAFHCRHAVEHACIAAGQRRLRAANMSPAAIEDVLDEQKRRGRHSTQRLMAIAAWGQASRWEEVRYAEIDRLNVLVHDDNEQEVEKTQGRYENLEALVSETAQLVETINSWR